MFSLFAKRNCSLQREERWRAFWLIASISAIIAVTFAFAGAWLILPFERRGAQPCSPPTAGTAAGRTMRQSPGLGGNMIGRWIAGALIALGSAAAGACRYNLQDPNSALGQDIYDLHTLVLWICVVIFVGVFGAMFYSVIYHRKSVGRKAAHFHENTVVEVIWTIVPFFVLIAIAWPATKTLIGQKDTPGANLTIEASGYQWKWGSDYLLGEGEGISFCSTVSSPREQVEGKASKGENYSEREGTFRGQCAELCGTEHGCTPIVVNVLSAEKYSVWVTEREQKLAAAGDDPSKAWTLVELKSCGEKVFAQNRVACQQANGKEIAGTFPALSGSDVVNGAKETRIDVFLNGVSKDGKPTAMVSFRQLSDGELPALITYTRISWTNNLGDAIAPADIKTARK